MGNRKIKVRPGRAGSVLGGAVGILFVILGVAMVIPAFGPFGVVWTVVAAALAVYHLANAFSAKGVTSQEIVIEDDRPPAEGPAESVEARLMRLEDLYARRVITQAEYEARRAEIIREL